MSKQEIIARTMQLLDQLPEAEATEILDFAAFLTQRKKITPVIGLTLSAAQNDFEVFQAGIANATVAQLTDAEAEKDNILLAQQMAHYVETSSVFAFLHDPAEDIYTLDDLEVRYR